MINYEQHPPTAVLINKIVAYTVKQFPADQTESNPLIQFIRLYYTHSSIEDLEARSIADLYGAALSHWELMKRRFAQELKVRVFNPLYTEHGWQSPYTVIEVITDDMPFLVDSMRMELNRMGLTIHLMIHMGGMCVVRDEQGEIINILSFEDQHSEAVLESPIYIEIDRQTDIKMLAKIHANVVRVLNDVRAAVSDWSNIQQKVKATINELMKRDTENEDIKETIAFMEWLLEDHFTFLGMRDYKVVGEGDNRALNLVPGSGLGVLRDDSQSKSYRHFSELPEAARKFALSKKNIPLISKTNTRSTVHRRAYTDCIGIKLFNKEGDLVGERRFIGLYTSSVYTGSPKLIPVIRKKVESIFKKSGLPLRSHAGKDLLHILSTLPRDDLFHGSPNELYSIAMGILHLQERRMIRLFAREDAYGRFISCLVYVPRENFNADLARQMQDILKKDLGGLEVSLSTHFSASILVRIHYVIRVDPLKRKPYDLKQIEQKLITVGQSWQDGFRESVVEYFGETRGIGLVEPLSKRFSGWIS